MSFSLDASVDVGLGVGGIAKDDSVVPFSLVAGAFVNGELRVVTFVGKEALHSLYDYDVTFVSDVAPTLLSACTFGFPACLTLHAAEHSPRVIQGTVTTFSIVGRVNAGRAAGRNLYRIRIEPSAALLTLSQRRRVFQSKSVRTIVSRILDAYDVAYDWRTNAADREWEFAYQAHETLWEFITRILATSGVSFCFEHAHGLLETLMPGSSAYAALGFNPMDLGADALGGGVVGAALSGAIGVVATPTRIVFFDEPRAAPAVSDELAVDEAIAGVASAALGAVASGLGDAVGGALGSVGVDLSMALGPKADAFDYEDGLAVVDGRERIESFIFSQNLRAKRAIVHEHLVAEHRHNMTAATIGVGEAWLSASLSGAVTAASDLARGNVMGALSASVPSLASFGADLSAPLLDADRMTIEEHGQDPSMLNPGWAVNVSTPEPALRALEQHRHDAFEAKGVTNSRRLAPGYRFRLQGHPIAECNREYLATSLHCEGIDPELAETDEVPFVYKASFRAVPAVHPVRPPKPPAVPRVGPENATVVGPPGTPIYVDALNRVQVQFDWAGQSIMPSDGERDIVGLVDNTCFLHVMTPMGSPGGYGMQQPLRVGTRVVVNFTDGQPERPFVEGCLPSNLQRPPFASSHVVGQKIRSEPSGRKYNELSLHNADGREKIQIHAARDLDVSAAHDGHLAFGHTLAVAVAADATYAVSGSDTVRVSGDRDVEIVGDLVDRVVGGRNVVTSGGVDHRVEGSERHSIAGTRGDGIGGNHEAHIEGNEAIDVVGARSVIVGRPGAETTHSHFTHGTHSIGADEVIIDATKRVLIRVGDSQLSIEPAALVLLAKALVGAGAESVQFDGGGAVVQLDGDVTATGKNATIASSGASLKLDSAFTAQGGSIKLGSGSGKSGSSDDKKKDDETQELHLVLSDIVGGAWKGHNFQCIVLGHAIDGTTDADGTLKVKVPKDAKKATLRVWTTDAYPAGPTMTIDVDIKEKALDDDDAGILQRLRHLRFFDGPDVDLRSSLAVDAITAFQTVHAEEDSLEPTGELDDATRAAIKKHHDV